MGTPSGMSGCFISSRQCRCCPRLPFSASTTRRSICRTCPQRSWETTISLRAAWFPVRRWTLDGVWIDFEWCVYLVAVVKILKAENWTGLWKKLDLQHIIFLILGYNYLDP